MVTNSTIRTKQRFKYIIGDCNRCNVKSDNYQSTNRQIGYYLRFAVVQQFAAIEYPKEETNI